MDVNSADLSRRNPKISEDTVFYAVYTDDATSFTPPLQAAASLSALLLRLHSLLAPFISNYIWQHEPFLLCAGDSSCPCRFCGSPPIPHLHGKTRFGDNLEDEWFVVFLLFEITCAIPNLSIRVWDSDGEFLLIEAAFSLPRWLNPESSRNRALIRAGNLHIIPRHIFPSNPSLSVSLEAVKNPEIDTRASDSIQSALKKKISGYPQKARENMHKVTVVVPLPVAQVLKWEPCLISLSVEGFYDRDADSLKDASRMEKFLRSEKENGEIEMARVSVEMSRAMYAQLVQQRFQAPKCYPMPSMKAPMAYKEAELGMKITCGFEMMYQEKKRNGEEGRGSTWDAFHESLERSGCFDGLLPGSKEYRRIMDSALEYYRSSSLFSRTRFANRKRRYQQRSQMSAEEIVEDKRKNSERQRRFQEAIRQASWPNGYSPPTKKSQRRDSSALLNSIPLQTHSTIEDSEEDNNFKEETGIDDTEDAFMQSYSDALNLELSSTTIKKSFIHAPRPPFPDNEGISTSGKHIDGDFTAVDVDMNLVQSFLDSYASQNGLPGPASNLLGLMGLKVPADESRDMKS